MRDILSFGMPFQQFDIGLRLPYNWLLIDHFDVGVHVLIVDLQLLSQVPGDHLVGFELLQGSIAVPVGVALFDLHNNSFRVLIQYSNCLII